MQKRYLESLARKFLSKARENLEDWTITLLGEEFTIHKIFVTGVHIASLVAHSLEFHEFIERKKYTDEEHDQIKEMLEETNEELHTIEHKINAMTKSVMRFSSKKNSIH